MPCLTDNCLVQTKMCAPSSFDCSQTLLCVSCPASSKADSQKTYSSAVTSSIRHEQQARAAIIYKGLVGAGTQGCEKGEPRSERN